MAALFGQQRVAQQQELSSPFKSITDAALDKAPLTARSRCGGVWSSSSSRHHNRAAAHPTGVTLETAGAERVHANPLHVIIPQQQVEAGADAADDSFDDTNLDSSRVPSHAGGAFVRINKLYERHGSDTQAAGSDQYGGLHAACIRAAAQPTAVHDNDTFQPAAAAASASGEGCISSWVDVHGVRGETMLYDNEAFDAEHTARQPTAVASGSEWTTSAHIRHYSKRPQQQQRRRQRAVGGGVSVPEHLRPRFSWSTAASRSKARIRSA